MLLHSGRIEAEDDWRRELGRIYFLEAKALFCSLDAFKARIPDNTPNTSALMSTLTANLCWVCGRVTEGATPR